MGYSSRVARAIDVILSPVGGDLVAFAQCCALDATVFPHSSLPDDATRAVFVARLRSDGPVVGFVATSMKGARARSAIGPRVVAIIGLAVDLQHRGRGLGGALLLHACREAAKRGLGQALLCVAVSNAGAIRLYESLGFTITRRRLGFYRTGDAYEMVKPLTE